MKKILLSSVCMAVAALGMVACGNHNRGTKTAAAEVDWQDTVSRHYVGTLPAADGPGIVYDLTLMNLAEDTLTGDYALSMTYLEAENGRNATFNSQGQWTAMRGIPGNPSAVCYQLVESGMQPDTTNLLYLGDSVVLLGADLQPAQSNLNYTLILED